MSGKNSPSRKAPVAPKKAPNTLSNQPAKTPLSAAEKQARVAYLKDRLERQIQSLQGNQKKAAQEKLKNLMDKVRQSTTRTQLEQSTFAALKEWRFTHSGDFGVQPEGKYYKYFKKYANEYRKFNWSTWRLLTKKASLKDGVLANAWTTIKTKLKGATPGNANDKQFEAFVEQSIRDYVDNLTKFDTNRVSAMEQSQLDKANAAFKIRQFNEFASQRAGTLGEKLKASDAPHLVAQAFKQLNSIQIPRRYADKYAKVKDVLLKKAASLKEKIKAPGAQMASLAATASAIMKKTTYLSRNAKLRQRILKRLYGVERGKTQKIETKLSQIGFSENPEHLKREFDQLKKLDGEAEKLQKAHQKTKEAAKKAQAAQEAQKALTPAEKMVGRWRQKYPWVDRLLKNPMVMALATLFFGISAKTTKLWGYSYTEKGKKWINRARGASIWFGNKLQGARDRIGKMFSRWTKAKELTKIQATYRIPKTKWATLMDTKTTLGKVMKDKTLPLKFRKELMAVYKKHKAKFDNRNLKAGIVPVQDLLYYGYKKWPYTKATPAKQANAKKPTANKTQQSSQTQRRRT